jgi:O-antigen ligase
MPRRLDTVVLAQDIDPALSAGQVLRWVGVSIVALMLFAAPLALGSVQTPAWAALWALAALSLVITSIVWLVEGRLTSVVPPILALLAVVCLVAALQLVPLPSKLFYLAGPGTHELHRTLQHGGGSWKVSLDPAKTVDALLISSMVLMACLSVSSLVNSRAMLSTLVAAVVAAAVVASVAGIAQENGTSEKVYGVFDLRPLVRGNDTVTAALDPALSSGTGRVTGFPVEKGLFFSAQPGVPDVFGPYANSNHFAGLVEIALPMLLGVLLALVATRRGGWADEGGFFGSAQGNLSLLAAFIIALGVAAVVYSHSFAGLGGLAVGLAVTGVLFGRSRRMTLMLLGGAVTVAAIAVVTAYTLRPGIFRLLPDVLESKLGGRLDVWRTAVRGIRDFPVSGTGLGTYASAAPRYEATETKYYFAHNDYLQIAFEIGLPLALVLAYLAWRQVRSLAARREKEPDVYCAAIAAGAAGSLAAIAFHSLFDYNLHVPANALALAVMASAGSVAAVSMNVTSETLGFTHFVLLRRRGAIAAVALALVAGVAAGGWCLSGAVASDMAKHPVRAAVAGLSYELPADAPEHLTEAYEAAGRACSLRPDDAEARYLRGILAAAMAHYAADSSLAAAAAGESLRSAVAAARSAPAYTYYAMTALSLGARDNDVTRKWPMASFDFKSEVARRLLGEGASEDALRWSREAFALATGVMNDLAPRANAFIAELVKHFGTYDRISVAAPDTFLGHLLFARGIEHAGLASAAVEEYALAAERAIEAGRGKGVSQRPVAEVAQALASRGRAETAVMLCSKLLDRHGDWQYLRLFYARILAGAGKGDDARREAEAILSARIPDWLKKDTVVFIDSTKKTTVK